MLLLTLELNWVPDYLGLSESEHPEMILEVIISVISSVIGISIALIIIAFETFKNKLGRVGIGRFFTNSLVIFIITFQITIICYSFFLLLSIGSPLDYKELSAIYFLSLLFIISIIIIWPLGKIILSDSESIKIVLNECEKITPQEISDIIGYSHGMMDYKREIDKIEGSPFIILRNLGINYTKESNQHIPALIIQETTNKFLPLITNKIDRRALREGYNTLFIVWNGIISESFSNNNFLALKEIWNSIVKIHNHHADNKIELIRTEALETFYENFIEQLLKNNQDDIITNGLFKIQAIFEKHLQKSVPKEELIRDIDYIFELGKNPKHNVDVELQWDHICEDIPRMIDIIIEKSLDYKRVTVLESAFLALSELINVAYNSKIGNYQKNIIIVSLFRNLVYSYGECIKKEVITMSRCMRVLDYTTDYFIEENPDYLKNIMNSLIEYLMDLMKAKKLDLKNGKSTLGGKFRHIVMLHEKGDNYSDIITLILDFIKWTKNQYENDQEIDAENYIALLEISKSLIHFHKLTHKLDRNTGWIAKEEGKISTELIKQIEQIIKSFKKIDEAKKKIQESTFKRI